MIKIHMFKILQLIGCKGSNFFFFKQNYTLGQTCDMMIEASVITVSNYPSAQLEH